MKTTLSINDRLIGEGHKPYVIAEISGNHNGDLNRALSLIEEAKKSGADAVKIQTYRPDTMTIDCDRDEFVVQGGLWDGKTLYELYEWAHTPWEWHEALFNRARELGVTLFSSPFDETAIELLEELNAPAYKIASFEMTDLPLVRKAAATGKPLIISTGMASDDEIAETVQTVLDAGNEQLVLLHCVSSYPATHEEYNLATIPDLRSRFNVPVGLSDHTLGNITAVASIALGACVVEKHFTHRRSDGGPDAAFSLEPEELTALCRDVGIAYASLGVPNYKRTAGEEASAVFRRSVYVVQDVKAGELFTNENVRRIRPGFGVAPKYLESILGTKAPCDIKRGTPFKAEWLPS